jgi:hypothetical protein
MNQLLKTARDLLVRAVWFVCAAVFLFEAWLWDTVGGGLKRLVALIPFDAFKQSLARDLAKLPAPVALLVFLLPLLVIEPFKVLGLWLIAHHHAIFGILAFVAAKVLGLGLVAFLFDATRSKLLSMPWFARFYAWVMDIRAKAHAIIEPYKLRLRAALAPFKARLKAMLALLESHGAFGRRLALLRARARRLRGLT